MKKRILILGNTIIALTIFFICLFGYQKFKKDYIKQIETNLRTVSKFYQENLDEYLEKSDYATLNQKTLATFSNLNLVDLRLTILDMDGQVLHDSDFPIEELNNHRSREEIYAIIKGAKEANTVRFSNTEKKSVLYFADQDPKHQLIIRVSSTLNLLMSSRQTFIRYGLIGGGISLFIFNLAVYVFYRKQEKMLSAFAVSLQQLKQGDLTQRLPEDRYADRDLYDLAQIFNPAIQSVEVAYQDMKAGRFWLQSLVNSLEEPLVVVNQEIDVVFINHYAQKIFNRQINPELNPYPLVLLTHEEALDSLCLTVIQDQKTLRKEFTLQIEASRNPFQVILSPVDAKHCIVLFHDMQAEYEIRQMRSDFVANVTHELKTPLTSIRGFIETLRQMNPNTSHAEAKHFLDIIDLEADRLTRLINDILRLSDIEHLVEDKGLENFDLMELIDECCVQFDELAMRHQVSLLPDEEPVFLPVFANRDRIKQIFVNLIDNAIKYNRENGKVFISACREQEFVEIRIKDTGEGFTEKEAKRIFERFYRVDKSRSRSLGGTGLGLSIVKHIALLYHGEVAVKSQLHQGTEFIVRLKI